MKKAFLYAIILAVLFANNVQAQSDQAEKDKLDRFHVSVGMKAGGSLASFSNGDFETSLKKAVEGNSSGAVFKDYSTNMFLNATAGIFLTFHFNRNWSFTPEVLLAVGGQKYDYKIGYQTGTDVQEVKSLTELNYLQVPLLLEYAYGQTNIQPYIKVGVTPAFLLKARDKKDYTITHNGQTTQQSSESDLVKLKNVNTNDNGATAALGVHLGQYFDLEARYNFGLESLSSDANSLWGNIRNQSTNLTLGVKF